MNKLLIFALAITAITCEKYHWAVLVAGSDGYSNYRHQSDVCHAYQILIAHGMNPEHIIVMAKDDIANNRANPIKGKIFNQPDGQDVYAGCKLDYTGNTVTPDNFMKILTGDENGMKGIGNGKVLKSDENSNVFIFFSDHGAEGLIAFPIGELYADEYADTMTKMHEKKMYKKLVFYLESCNSGSMFNDFPEAKNMNIYEVSAASPYESSYACYCGSEAKVGGISIGSCLGDEFSCNWMENSDAVDFNTYTFGEQVDHVKSVTTGSNVMEWADTTPRSELLKEFQGDYDQFVTVLAKFLKAVLFEEKELPKKINKIKNTNMLLEYLKGVAETSKNQRDWAAYHYEEAMHKRSANIFATFDKALNVPRRRAGKVDYDCYRRLMKIYKHKCGYNVDRDHGFLGSFYRYCSATSDIIPAYEVLRDTC